nr:expressed protein [Hymenolepis microstoma]
MASQLVESQVFPIQLEWIGGRSTFIQGPFSVRNAYICLEDMKEQNVAIPLIIEKMQNLVVFRQGNRTMDKVLELEDIVQIHCFPTDPNYAIFEINEHDGSARFEVIRAPENESLKILQDFIFTPHFAGPSAPVLPEQNANCPAYHEYETPKPNQIVTNDGASPNFQVTEDYEGMAAQIIDETINESASPAARSRDSPSAMGTKAEISVKEVDRSRETPSTTSVSSDTPVNSGHPQEFTVELINEETEDSTQQEPQKQQQQQQERPPKAVTSNQRKFAKVVTLTEIIAEEGINTQNYCDDGKFYVVSRKGPRPSNPKSFKLQSSGYSRNQLRNRHVSPSLHICMETPNESCLTDLDVTERFFGSEEDNHVYQHRDGIYYFKRSPSTLQYNSSNLPPYDESYYSFVYMKKKYSDSSSSDTLNS